MNKEGHVGLVKNTMNSIQEGPSEHTKVELDKMKEDAEEKRL